MTTNREQIALFALYAVKQLFLVKRSSVVPTGIAVGAYTVEECDLSEAMGMDNIGKELAAAKLRVAARHVDANHVIFTSAIRSEEEETGTMRYYLIALVRDYDGSTEARQEYDVIDRRPVFFGEPVVTDGVKHILIDGLFDRRAEDVRHVERQQQL